MLKELCAKANPRKQKNLNIIYSICKDQHDRGSKNFTITMIGNLSEAQGGPKTQSIRNTGGLDFRALIESWADYSTGYMKKKKKPKINDRYLSFIESLERADQRAVFTKMLSDKRRLQNEVNSLKHFINNHKDILLDERPIKQYQMQPITPEVLPSMNPSSLQPNGPLEIFSKEIQDLKSAIDDDTILGLNLVINEDGSIFNKKGRIIYGTEYLTAIKKIIQTYDPDDKVNISLM